MQAELEQMRERKQQNREENEKLQKKFEEVLKEYYLKAKLEKGEMKVREVKEEINFWKIENEKAVSFKEIMGKQIKGKSDNVAKSSG